MLAFVHLIDCKQNWASILPSEASAAFCVFLQLNKYGFHFNFCSLLQHAIIYWIVLAEQLLTKYAFIFGSSALRASGAALSEAFASSTSSRDEFARRVRATVSTRDDPLRARLEIFSYGERRSSRRLRYALHGESNLAFTTELRAHPVEMRTAARARSDTSRL